MDRMGDLALLSIGETRGPAPGGRVRTSAPAWPGLSPPSPASDRFRLYEGRGYRAGEALNVITALYGLLTDAPATPCPDAATTPGSDLRRLAKLDDLLDVGLLQTGVARLDHSVFQLEPLFRQMETALGERREGVALRFDVRAAAKPPVRGDRARLTSLLSHLVAHALRTGSAKRLEVVADHTGDALTIGVRAIGQAGEDNSSCVAVYWADARSQADEYEHRQVGLELAIAQSLTLLMQGTLAVEERSGGSVNACLRLPLEQA